MRKFAPILMASAMIGLGGAASAGGPAGPTLLTDADMSSIVAGHRPGIARDIEPFGLIGNGDGTPAGNGHEGVLHANSVGGSGLHPNTQTEFAGPSHPLMN